MSSERPAETLGEEGIAFFCQETAQTVTVGAFPSPEDVGEVNM